VLFWILVMIGAWAAVGVAFVVAFNVLGLQFDIRSRSWYPEAGAVHRLAPRSRWVRLRAGKHAASPEAPPSS
jgi:hypothetical protein